MEPTVIYPQKTIIELEMAGGLQVISAVIERRNHLQGVAHRLVRVGLDASEVYRVIATLAEVEAMLRGAFDIPAPEWTEPELREAYGK